MPKMKLTSAAVLEMACPEKGQVLVFDTALPGFGVRLTPGSKSYFCEMRVSGKTRRVTLGKSAILTTEDAKREAKKTLGKMESGIDPTAQKAEERAKTITLDAAGKAYLSARTLKPASRAEYERILATYFGDWGNRELGTLSPAVVSKRFATLTGNNGKGTANAAFRVFRDG